MKKLQKYLKAKGITKIFFANNIGVSRQVFNSWMNEGRKIPPEYWRKICELTDEEITIEDFLNDAEEK